MSWRLAKSLETLRNQVNAAYPNRSKLSDGAIGDAAHQRQASDHNPNAQGVVCALDITHHPGYFDVHAMANTILANRHPNLKYIISNRRIAGAWTGWKWTDYDGSNPHTKHAHFSVGVGSDGKSQPPYDSTAQWSIKPTKPVPPAQGGKKMTTAEATSFVKSMYSQILGRSADSGGLNNYVGHIVAGRYTPEKVVNELLNSAEGRAYFKKKYETIRVVEKIVYREKPGGSAATEEQVLGGQIVSLIKKVK